MTRATRRSVALGVILSLAAVAAAPAEELAGVVVTPRVRITAPAVSGKRLVGDLLAMDEATLTLKPQKGKGVIEIPRTSVTRIEVSRRPSRRGKGAGIGALAGLGAAAAIGVIAGDSGCVPDNWICYDKGATALISAVLTVPVGLLFGIGIAGGEQWVRTTPDRIRLSVQPRTNGLGAALSVRF